MKLIGEALVGSAWPTAWLIVTVGLAASTAPGSSIATRKRLARIGPTLLEPRVMRFSVGI